MSRQVRLLLKMIKFIIYFWFQVKVCFLSLWISVLFPLHLVLIWTVIWDHSLPKDGESNFLCKREIKKRTLLLSSCWKPFDPDTFPFAILPSVKRTSTQASAVVDKLVPRSSIAPTFRCCTSVGPWLVTRNGWRMMFWSTKNIQRTKLVSYISLAKKTVLCSRLDFEEKIDFQPALRHWSSKNKAFFLHLTSRESNRTLLSLGFWGKKIFSLHWQIDLRRTKFFSCKENNRTLFVLGF